jgi:hypothetical protein
MRWTTEKPLMNTKLTGRFAAAALATLFAATAVAADAVLTDDGLEPVKVRNIDKAYKRPGASLAGYQQILFKPVSVEFSKSWNPRNYGSFGLKSTDVEKIRSSLATLANETFSKTLAAGGYPVVTSAGENVLEVEAHIIDLFVNAPDVATAGNSRSYVLSAGEMRLAVTLRDSVTGTVLYRAIDRKRGPETGRLEWASSVFNRMEAERALSDWARQLKQALDEARSN